MNIESKTACGLYYLAEITEEYATPTKHVIKLSLVFSITCNLLLFMFDGFPFFLTAVGLAAHSLYYTLLRNFPSFEATSPQFVASIGEI